MATTSKRGTAQPTGLAPMQPVTAVYASTRTGMKLVEAEIVGPFAVHRAVHADWNQDLYTLTHVGSGGVLASVPSLQVGRDLAVTFQGFDLDWNFRDLGGMGTFPLAVLQRLYDAIASVATPAGKRPTRSRTKR